MITIYSEPDHRVLCGSSLAPHDLPDEQYDALITDPPYSAKTHGGHRAGKQRDGGVRADLDYTPWDRATVELAVGLWTPRVHGWIVIMTDHILAPAWSAALETAGLYVFAPLPFVSPGSRVRLQGDGPSSWSVWIVTARPRREPYSKWGTLPGAYVMRPEHGMPVVGCKPMSLMRSLVYDYSREGDLIWDPCCGGGSTLVAAKETDRRSTGIDVDHAHCAIAAQRLRSTQQLAIKFPSRPAGKQEELL